MNGPISELAEQVRQALDCIAKDSEVTGAERSAFAAVVEHARPVTLRRLSRLIR